MRRRGKGTPRENALDLGHKVLLGLDTSTSTTTQSLPHECRIAERRMPTACSITNWLNSGGLSKGSTETIDGCPSTHEHGGCGRLRQRAHDADNHSVLMLATNQKTEVHMITLAFSNIIGAQLHCLQGIPFPNGINKINEISRPGDRFHPPPCAQLMGVAPLRCRTRPGFQVKRCGEIVFKRSLMHPRADRRRQIMTFSFPGSENIKNDTSRRNKNIARQFNVLGVRASLAGPS